MKKPDSELSIKELEILCNLYLECKLSALEEKELELILSYCPVKTPLIQEVKKIMGHEEREYIKLSTPQTITTRKFSFSQKLSYGLSGVAASLLVLFISGFILLKFNNPDEGSEAFYCQVYSNGKEIPRDEAMKIANHQLSRMKAFEEKIKLIENQEQEKVENFENVTEQLK